MAKDRMDVLELLRKEAHDADIDFLREGLRMLVQAVMEAEVTSKTGAGLDERSPERLTHRTGYRDRMAGLGLEYIGPQWPNAARQLSPDSGFSDDARNVPTYHTVKQTPETAMVQLDNVFASRGFHESIRVHALNGVDEWGPSDHCRLLLEVR